MRLTKPHYMCEPPYQLSEPLSNLKHTETEDLVSVNQKVLFWVKQISYIRKKLQCEILKISQRQFNPGTHMQYINQQETELGCFCCSQCITFMLFYCAEIILRKRTFDLCLLVMKVFISIKESKKTVRALAFVHKKLREALTQVLSLCPKVPAFFFTYSCLIFKITIFPDKSNRGKSTKV